MIYKIDTGKKLITQRSQKQDDSLSEIEKEREIIRGISALIVGTARKLYKTHRARRAFINLLAEDAQASLDNTEEGKHDRT